MPLIVYSLLRLALLAGCLLALWAVGLGGWLLVVVATVVAWAASYLLLGRQRDGAARWLAERDRRRRASGRRFSARVDTDAEDEDAEAGSVEEPADRHGQIDRPSPSSTP